MENTDKKDDALSGRKPVSRLLLIGGVILLAVYLIKSIPPLKPAPVTEPSQSFAESSPSSGAEAPSSESSGEPVVYPVGEMLLTSAREEYSDGEMLLSIPRLGLEDVPVLSGDSFTVLAKGIGLYDYSCLPGEAENANVSIIAHRDVAGKEFYYIDTMQSGDVIYLKYKNMLYTYEYSMTTIVNPNNTAIVPCRDTACVTLVSCHPIGTTLKRIVVIGELIASEPME